ncbi:MAG: preprotein translocase subunit SecA [Bacteroidetes bacterium]|nr:preprotein translocase subunit SecA [Bacteroidota bacterium]
MLKFISKVFGSKSGRDVKKLNPYVDSVNEAYSKLPNLTNDELRNKTHEFRAYIKEQLKDIDLKIEEKKTIAEDDAKPLDEREGLYTEIDEMIKERDKQLEVVLDELLPDAFAVVKETAKRFRDNPEVRSTATDLDRELVIDRGHMEIDGDQVIYKNKWIAGGTEVEWNMVHYDVQIIGGVVLHQGKIAEMATGEGKTLVATLPMYLNALPQQGVHIITVNNYLAKRDSEWMGPLMNFLGITVDCIDNYKPHSEERKTAYKSDVTYGTNNEFGFDYLRDNMVVTPKEQVQQKLHYAMIDEVDSVLIDDARTPLIISGPIPKGDEHQFHALKPRIQGLVDLQRKTVTHFLQDAKRLIKEGKTGPKEGEGGLALLRAHRGLPRNNALIKYLSEEGIRNIMQKTENHWLQDQAKEMPFVDSKLYFTIEEKQNQIEMTDLGLDKITADDEDKEFFVMPDIGGKIAEIENSALDDKVKLEAKDKLLQEFSVKTERVHSVQQLLKAYCMFEKDVEYVVMDSKVKIVDEQTGRIMDGRRYSDGLHQAIEAKENVKVEAATQTFATITLQNFFRMYHKLAGMTGTAETEAGEFWEIYKLDTIVIPTNRPIIRDDRDDKVFKTKREKLNAIIDEVMALKEAGRPVLVGTTSVEVSELLSRMLKIRKIEHNVLNAKQHGREADIVAAAGQAGTVTIATNMAGRGTDIKLGEGVKEAGGLAIVGSERHDSRRVDRQLRGRSGRQGDPGSTQFYLSLEDNLMRLFGSERIAKVMDKMGYKEGEVIQHSMITKSIERAQSKVEENNFGIRKRLLEYDDVMNAQRDVIYKRRQHALYGERLTFDLNNMFYDLCEEVVETHQAVQDYKSFQLDCIRLLSVDTEITEEEFKDGDPMTVGNHLFDEVMDAYHRKSEAIVKMVMPTIDTLHKRDDHTYERIVVPFTDGVKTINAVVNIEESYADGGKDIMKTVEKNITLALIDNAWKEQLRQMDDLKQSVQLAVHEQKDPLLVYKFEAFGLFKIMLGEISKDVTSFLFKGSVPIQQPDQVRQARDKQQDYSRMKEGRGGMPENGSGGPQPPKREEQKKVEPVRVGPKVGRNDPCPCGSGKKYKHCHGKG